MLKRLLALAASGAALGVAAATAWAATAIETGDDFFRPGEVAVALGEQASWSWGPPDSLNEHNVREDGKLFYSGRLTRRGEFAIAPSAGSFHYYCELHGFEGGGMDGVIKVRPVLRSAAAGAGPLRIVWADPESDTGDTYDVRYRAGNGKFQPWRRGTTQAQGSFGRNGKPEAVEPGTRYQFQARSRDGKAASDWSPRLTVRPG